MPLARACLKIHSRQMRAPLRGIFEPNSGYIARYAPFIWLKSPTNCDAHLSESNFQTRSSGFTQEDFAKRLDTTPENLSLLVRGEQRLSIDIAVRLSRMLGTSVAYWLNLQNVYDSIIAEPTS